MLSAPREIRRQGEHAAQEADGVVQVLGPEEGRVAAVVLDDEHPNQEARRQWGQAEGDPVGISGANVHRGAHGQKAADGDQGLEDARADDRGLEARDALFESERTEGGKGRLGGCIHPEGSSMARARSPRASDDRRTPEHLCSTVIFR